MSLRSLAPPAFVVSVLVLGVLDGWWEAARLALALEVGLYVAAALAFAALAISIRREPWRFLPRVVAAFATFHVAYGLGMVRGWATAWVGLFSKRRESAPQVCQLENRSKLDAA
jgi:hypothetical protein